SQRLVSPLDWANTRRTFQGIKGFWHSEKLDVDAWLVQPIIINPTRFDSPDDKQTFAGFWTTYRPNKSQAIDAYYLYLDNTRNFTGQFGATGGYHVNTIGARYAGDYKHVLWDFEAMYQFGDWVNQSISADSYTTGIGYDFKGLPMDPQFWLYWDFASGDRKYGTDDEHGTFNQLFPLGHQYFGYLDLIGRQNIEDLSMQFVFFPAKWITGGIQYHIFRLDSATDALYNAGGTAIRRSPTGTAGRDVGDEIDIFNTYHLGLHSDLLFGYSHLFAGTFIKKTGGPLDGPDLFYAQYSFRW
ncbi:MAG TPA: alginate export family protein, partial [Gemmataceae bacterium]|nr:alginate export family protein [Gemmataceae bacterium]